MAVFIDGCFWHGCPIHHTRSKTNAEYWQAKVTQNRARDRDTDRLLEQAGWISLRIWEHEDVNEAAGRVVSVVRGRQDR